MGDYPVFGKIPRLHKPVTLTEKIDGTNGLIAIHSVNGSWQAWRPESPPLATVDDLEVYAGSRNRWLAIGGDNYGFARWATDNAAELVKLGVGRHYGEWWGAGIQRGYGYTKSYRKFSLFNTAKWTDDVRPACCDVVPVVARGDGSELNDLVTEALLDLNGYGSMAAPGYMRPEGIVVFHTASNAMYKVTLPDDPKSMAPVKAEPLKRQSEYMTWAVGYEPKNLLRPPGLTQQTLEAVPA